MYAVQEKSGPMGYVLSKNAPNEAITLETQLFNKNHIPKDFNNKESFLHKIIKIYKTYLYMDFGTSLFQKENVLPLVAKRLYLSLKLSFLTLLGVIFFSIPLTLVSVQYQQGAFYTFFTNISLFFYSIPTFVWGIFFVLFGGCAVFGTDNKHCIYPLILLLIHNVCKTVFFLNHHVLAESHKKYVLLAKTKGISIKKILTTHVCPNMLIIFIPYCANLFLQMLLSSVFVLEILFNIKGIAGLMLEATLSHDYPLMLGAIYILSIIGLTTLGLSNFLQKRIDPRLQDTQKL